MTKERCVRVEEQRQRLEQGEHMLLSLVINTLHHSSKTIFKFAHETEFTP